MWRWFKLCFLTGSFHFIMGVASAAYYVAVTIGIAKLWLATEFDEERERTHPSGPKKPLKTIESDGSLN